MQTSYINTICAHLKQNLQAQVRILQQEINNYPPPIPACDAQFNYLIELRSNIYRDIGRIDKLAAQTLTPDELSQLIDEFMSASPFIDEATQSEVKAQLGDLSTLST